MTDILAAALTNVHFFGTAPNLNARDAAARYLHVVREQEQQVESMCQTNTCFVGR